MDKKKARVKKSGPGVKIARAALFTAAAGGLYFGIFRFVVVKMAAPYQLMYAAALIMLAAVTMLLLHRRGLERAKVITGGVIAVGIAFLASFYFVLVTAAIPYMWLYAAALLLMTAALIVLLMRLRLPWLVVISGGILADFGVYWLVERLSDRPDFMPMLMLTYLSPALLLPIIVAVVMAVIRHFKHTEREEQI